MSLINQIILLQDVDNKLFEINKLLGDLPTKVQELTEEEDSVKISLENKTNSNNLSKLIRSKLSGYSIDDIKIIKTPDITSSERYRMDNKEYYPRPFIYSFDVTPVKIDS